MEMDKEVIIDLKAMQGRILSGRERGKEMRRDKKIDDLEKKYERIIVQFPETVLAISSSFFLGMFGPSIMGIGSKAAFDKKFELKMKASLKPMIDGYINFALENKNII